MEKPELGYVGTDQMKMSPRVTNQINLEKMKTDKLSRHLIDSILRVHSKQILLCCAFIIIMFIIYIGNYKIQMSLWHKQLIYSSTNFKNLSHQIDTSRSPRRFDVILSYYYEDVTYVARFIRYLRNLPILQKVYSRIIVYNKNFKVNDTYLKEVLKADIIIQLPNLGREGGTYLYHIIANYDTLATHLIFCQAGVEGITDTGLADWFLHRLEKQFNLSVGYMPLVENKWVDTLDCGATHGENTQRLSEFWGILEQTLCPPGRIAVAYRGQFLVSAKRIHNRPLRIYQYIYNLITANQTHWLHNDPHSFRYIHASVPDNPNFGHYVERLWTILFSCAKPDLRDRCERNECACFD